MRVAKDPHSCGDTHDHTAARAEVPPPRTHPDRQHRCPGWNQYCIHLTLLKDVGGLVLLSEVCIYESSVEKG